MRIHSLPNWRWLVRCSRVEKRSAACNNNIKDGWLSRTFAYKQYVRKTHVICFSERVKLFIRTIAFTQNAVLMTQMRLVVCSFKYSILDMRNMCACEQCSVFIFHEFL